jgi:hypothetical protein
MKSKAANAAFAATANADAGKQDRIPNAKSIGWAIYAAGFVIWLFGYLSVATLQYFVGTRLRRGGFLVSFPISKQNLDLRSRSRA